MPALLTQMSSPPSSATARSAAAASDAVSATSSRQPSTTRPTRPSHSSATARGGGPVEVAGDRRRRRPRPAGARSGRRARGRHRSRRRAGRRSEISSASVRSLTSGTITGRTLLDVVAAIRSRAPWTNATPTPSAGCSTPTATPCSPATRRRGGAVDRRRGVGARTRPGDRGPGGDRRSLAHVDRQLPPGRPALPEQHGHRSTATRRPGGRTSSSSTCRSRAIAACWSAGTTTPTGARPGGWLFSSRVAQPAVRRRCPTCPASSSARRRLSRDARPIECLASGRDRTRRQVSADYDRPADGRRGGST